MPNGVTKETFKDMTIKSKLDVVYDYLDKHGTCLTEIKTRLALLPCSAEETNNKWLRRMVVVLIIWALGISAEKIVSWIKL